MKKLKELLIKYWWIVLIVIIGLGLFCWYQIRPSYVYSVCNEKAKEKAREILKTKTEISDDNEYKEASEKGLYLKDDYEYYYKQCLRSKGINK